MSERERYIIDIKSKRTWINKKILQMCMKDSGKNGMHRNVTCNAVLKIKAKWRASEMDINIHIKELLL